MQATGMVDDHIHAGAPTGDLTSRVTHMAR